VKNVQENHNGKENGNYVNNVHEVRH